MATELRTIPTAPTDPDERNSHQEELGENLIPMLPPVDKGTEAWKFLLGSFMIEAVLWGMSFTPSLALIEI